MRRFAAGATVLLLLVGCASVTLVPGGEKIKLTKVPADVEGCKILGAVKAEPPFIMPHDDEKLLQNDAAVLGADTVLITSGANVAAALFLPPEQARQANIRRGVAYKCEGFKGLVSPTPTPTAAPGR